MTRGQKLHIKVEVTLPTIKDESQMSLACIQTLIVVLNMSSKPKACNDLFDKILYSRGFNVAPRNDSTYT